MISLRFLHLRHKDMYNIPNKKNFLPILEKFYKFAVKTAYESLF